MTPTIIIRPGARTQVRGLPWTGRPTDNYALLEKCISASRRGQVTYTRGCFSVTRNRTRALISGLAEHFGQAHIIQYGGAERCVEACWDANPETAELCECACAGGNHGTGEPLGEIVNEDPERGAVSVLSHGPREYDVVA